MIEAYGHTENAADLRPARFTRARIKALKRLVLTGMRVDASPARRQLAQDAAVLLLERSVAMAHDRLFLHRLADAMALGAPIGWHAWAHCAAMIRDRARLAIWCAAARKIHPSLPTIVQHIGACSSEDIAPPACRRT